MPFVGEQPTQAGKLTITGRSSNTIVEVTTGVFTVTTRSGTVEIGVT